MIIRQVANFLCRGKLFDENGDLIKVKFKICFSSYSRTSKVMGSNLIIEKLFLNLYKNHDAVITDIPILKTLLLDCTIWSKDTISWSIQLQILISLVREAHKYRTFNLRVLIEAETVLRLLETLQITLSDNPKLEITDSISDQLIELIRVLIGYPPDTKIISRVFDFCCGVHPPAQAYVTNTHHKECFLLPLYVSFFAQNYFCSATEHRGRPLVYVPLVKLYFCSSDCNE